MRRPPAARMVTPEAPVKVVRKAQMRTLMIVAPPGSQPRTARKSRTSLSPALLSEMMKPASVKSGIAGISGPESITYPSLGTASSAPPEWKKKRTARPPRRM